MIYVSIPLLAFAVSTAAMAFTKLKVDYLDPERIAATDYQLVQDGLTSLERSWQGYVQDNAVYSWSCQERDGMEAECGYFLTADSFPSQSVWRGQLTPRYGFLPKDTSWVTWAYGVAGERSYVCAQFTSALTTTQSRAMRRLINNRPGSQVSFSGSCGEEEAARIAGESTAITYWLEADMVLSSSDKAESEMKWPAWGFCINSDGNKIKVKRHEHREISDEIPSCDDDQDAQLDCEKHNGNGNGNAYGHCKDKNKECDKKSNGNSNGNAYGHCKDKDKDKECDKKSNGNGNGNAYGHCKDKNNGNGGS